MKGSTTGAPLAPARKTSGAPLPARRECVRQPSTSTKWSLNGMPHPILYLPAGDARFQDDVGDLEEVHRCHDVRAGHAGNLGQLAQHLDANLASLGLGIARFLEAIDM